VLAALGMLGFTIAGFSLIGFAVDPAEAYVLRTALDDAIPFLPWSVYVYSWVYSSMLYPLFTVRSGDLFWRVVAAYGLVVAVSLLVFAVFPVTSVGLRPDVSTLDTALFHNWGVRLTYTVDPPANLFPSLHMSIAAIAALSAWKARRLYGLLAAPIVLGIAVTICTMKQHFVADGVAALVLVAVVYRLTLHGWPRAAMPRAERAFTWRGPVAYVAFHAMVYGGLYVTFRLAGDLW